MRGKPKGATRELSTIQKLWVCGLHDDGYTVKELAKMVRVKPAIIKSIIDSCIECLT